MGAELQHAIETGNENPEVDVFVLTGAGRGFVPVQTLKTCLKIRQTEAKAPETGPARLGRPHQTGKTDHSRC